MGDCIKTKTLLVDIQENGIIRENKSGRFLCRVGKDFDAKVIMKTNFESLPTCTPNKRAFLDEIREKGEFSDRNNEYTGIAIGEYTFINQSDFTKCNISELVERKE